MPFKFAGGGIVGYASICGTIVAAGAAIEYAFGHKAAKKIMRHLMRWYEVTPFPTEEANRFAAEGKFYTKGKTTKVLPSVEGDSVLCHVVVSRWCQKTGYASGSKERSERCARIAGAVARQAVLFMNAYARGEDLDKVFPFKLSSYTQSCRKCHYKGKHPEQGQFERGFMECSTCHEQNLQVILSEKKFK